MHYLCFKINSVPDLTMAKYSTYDISGLDDLKEKHGVFLRQLYRLGYAASVYFHLLYVYDPSDEIQKGHHLDIIFYATSENPENLNRIREFITTSVLSSYYDFYCYEVSDDYSLYEGKTPEEKYIKFRSNCGTEKFYRVNNSVTMDDIDKTKEMGIASFEIAPDLSEVVSINRYNMTPEGKFVTGKDYRCAAFLTKKDYSLPALNYLSTDIDGPPMLYSVLGVEPCKDGRLYNVLKLMEGYNEHVAVRIDLFPVDMTRTVLESLPYGDTRKRAAQRDQGRDDNSENMIREWDNYIKKLNKYPQFRANIVAFSDYMDIAVMLADSIGSEAIESGTYKIEEISTADGYSIDLYYGDNQNLCVQNSPDNYVADFLSLYTLDEIRPMFSFPILNQGENIEKVKETDPIFYDDGLFLGTSETGYDVTLPIEIFKKHAFVAGVPGSGKTNTMLYLVTTLWRDFKIPFLVLEPAKQEYRALASIPGMEELCIFSPRANTKFHLHINPFEFPVGLTLAEHIANLKAVFAGAFELPPPSPHFIDTCIEKIYLDKGWTTFSTNDGTLPYPNMQNLYDSLKEAVEKSSYRGEIQSNLRAVLEVRIGSLLKREIGKVYNVSRSIIRPEEWLDFPAVIELEALGEGPANFMSLILSTLIREDLHVRMTVNKQNSRDINHIVFYEEAHNLIGPNTDSPMGDSVDPKISATKYLAKMLAEVRALKEGIVIADQLPTVMAAEVLKNTGLKIGHRITAIDDRQLLGGTMSASASQMEEQGSFLPGDALVTYEGLMKPFKMKIAAWENGAVKTGESPDDMELWNLIKNHPRSLQLMKNSSQIIIEKIRDEFNAVFSQMDICKNEYDKLLKQRELYFATLKADENIISSLENADEIKRKKEEKDKFAVSGKEIFFSELRAVNKEFEELTDQYIFLYNKYMTIFANFGKETPFVLREIINNCYIGLGYFNIPFTLDDVKKFCFKIKDILKDVITCGRTLINTGVVSPESIELWIKIQNSIFDVLERYEVKI